MSWRPLACTVLAFACASCGTGTPAAPPAAVSAKPAVHEEDLAGIGLDADQQRRLGIETAPAAVARLPRRRLFAGDVVLALGGFGDASERRGGAHASHPLLPPQTSADLERVAEQQLAADAALEAARIALAAAQRALTREQGLIDAQAGSGRALDAARAQQDLAQAALQSAVRRRQLLGDPVFEALASGRRLVRVAVYAGELARIDPDAEAALAPLGAPEAEATRALRPVRVSVSSTPATATTDLYYAPLEIRPELRPGERVAVFLPLRGEVESVVVARSALLRDIHGGAWVYEQTQPDHFVRRRIQVSETLGDRVALASGPKPGAAIVTAGAAELFGAERLREVGRMRWLVGTALRFRVLVVALAALLLVLGIGSAQRVALDAFPEFAPPLVEIQTEAPGLSTEEVESLVSAPLEAALNGTPRLATLRSKSVLGLSSVVLIFEDGTDLLLARQAVQERLAAGAGRLSALASAPVVLPPLSSTSRALKLGLTSPSLSQLDLTTLALWTIRPRLMAIPGVAGVAIWGQRPRQLQVEVDPDRLAANGVTLEGVLRATAEAVAVGGGGFVDTPNQRLALRQTSLSDDPQALSGALLELRGGSALRLGDVADVKIGSPPAIGDAIVNDVPGLLLVIEKDPRGNTLAVTRQVEAALAALGPALAGVEIDTRIFRPASFIEQSIANLGQALLLGSGLVAGVLLVFFFEWRAALISLVTIPLAVAIAILVLHAQGAALNTMVLAGLAIAVGVVVDDAVIDVENIARRLRLARLEATPRPALSVVLDASLEVRSAVVLASAIVALVFVPVFFLPGLAGAFFRPLGAAYVLAVLASLGVALTLTPALALVLLPYAPQRHRDAPLLQRSKVAYRRLLPWFLDRPQRAIGVLGAALLAALALLPLLGEEFLPDFRERNFLMHWVERPGTSLEALRRVTLRVSRELRAIPGVRSFGSHLGRAEQADEVVGPNFSELWIGLDENVDYETAIERIEAVIHGYPGIQRDVLTYLRERIKEVLTGAGASLVVRIYGPDLEGLRRQAQAVAGAIQGIAGVKDLKVEAQALVPQIEVRLEPDAAALAGLSAAQLQRAVATYLQGAKVGEVRRDQKRFDVVVIGSPRVRQDVEAIERLPIETPAGAFVPLGDLAAIDIVAAPNEVKREGASRRIDVTCNVEGADLGRVAREIETRVRALEFEPESHPEFLGEYAARAEARTRLAWLGGAALAGIFLLLHADFGSLRLAALVFLTLPFALVGSLVAALVSGGTLSLGSLVGLVSVLGIAARNGIMLLSHYRHLEREEGEPFGRALLLRGAEERLAPILMTALCAALALLPLVVGGGRPGQEIEHPMAVVILGGLVSSTVLNLLLMPALYGRFGRALALPVGNGDGPPGTREER